MQKDKEFEFQQYCHPKDYKPCRNTKKSNKKRFWTKRQDQILQQGVKKYGCKKWSKISKLLKKRNPKRCRERWFNYLKQQNKVWDENSLWVLYLAYRIYGRKWAQISKILNRGDNVIKNKVNCFKNNLKLQFQQKINQIRKNIGLFYQLSQLEKQLIKEISKTERNIQQSQQISEQKVQIQKKQNSIIASNQEQILEKYSYYQQNFALLTSDYLSITPYRPIFSVFYPYISYWPCI